MPYLIDSDVLIEAKRRYYAPDFCPAFWDWLVDANARRRVYSIEKVEEELLVGKDALATWARGRGPTFFLKPDATLLPALGKVSTWVRAQSYRPGAVAELLSKADYYLVAHALAHGHDVVTHEVAESRPDKVKIPEPCLALGVRCVSPFSMLRTEGARFILGPA
jgi:hypothetical protein